MRREPGRSNDVGTGRNRTISSEREQKGRGEESGAGIGQAAGVAARRRAAAMRRGVVRRLLLGAGRRIPVHGIPPERRPDEDLRDICGKTSWELCSRPPVGSDSWERHRSALADHTPFRDVVHPLGTERGVRYLSFSGQPAFDQRGRFKGYRGVAQDVSARMRAEHLAHLERLVARALAETDDFAAGVRTALRAMCKSEQWTAGNLWIVDDRTRALRHLVGSGDAQ